MVLWYYEGVMFGCQLWKSFRFKCCLAHTSPPFRIKDTKQTNVQKNERTRSERRTRLLQEYTAIPTGERLFIYTDNISSCYVVECLPFRFRLQPEKGEYKPLSIKLRARNTRKLVQDEV